MLQRSNRLFHPPQELCFNGLGYDTRDDNGNGAQQNGLAKATMTVCSVHITVARCQCGGRSWHTSLVPRFPLLSASVPHGNHPMNAAPRQLLLGVPHVVPCGHVLPEQRLRGERYAFSKYQGKIIGF